jgi:RHH-type proline utilization regulon transcriptional repressor/proline dehydrogenase/delta 1-pyrroline-5-carboxylate dehydrogenase
MIDRSALRAAYRPDEERVVEERLAQAALPASAKPVAAAIARTLVERVRAHKPAGLDAFMHAYDLGSDEGVALMCLAEALLRIPDTETADDLIHDKLSGPDWAEKLGGSRSTFVNAAPTTAPKAGARASAARSGGSASRSFAPRSGRG